MAGDSQRNPWFVAIIVALIGALGMVAAQVLPKWLDDGDDATPSPGPAVTVPGPGPSEPQGDEFRVIELLLRADPADYSGACPVTVKFSGRVSAVGGSGTVTYRFLRSDNASDPVKNLEFEEAGSKEVEDEWTLFASYDGWEAIEILEPSNQESDRAEFSVRCE